jgi:hypothetical protein
MTLEATCEFLPAKALVFCKDGQGQKGNLKWCFMSTFVNAMISVIKGAGIMAE